MGNVNKLSDFESIICLVYTEKQYRQEAHFDEMCRVGLKISVEYHWNFPTPYDKWEMDRLPIVPFVRQRIGCYNVSKGHYAAIKTAYHLGVKTLLIMEDDCRFLKDLNKLEEYLSEAPDDWDVLMLDHFRMRGDVVQVNKHWARCRASASCACYAVNRKAMERLIRMYESAVKGNYRAPLLRNCDMWLDTKYLGDDVNFYCSTPNLAVQCQCPDESNCGRTHCDGKYEAMGISYADYATYDTI